MIVRHARASLALCTAVLIGANALPAQGVEYASGTTRYQLSKTSKGTQTSPMGNGTFDIGIEQQVTVNLMRHGKDTVMATFTLDSVVLKSSGPAPVVNSLKGAKFVSLISPTGRFYSVTNPADLDPTLGQLVEGLPRILPTFRANLAAGQAWSDTTSDRVTQQGMELDRKTISAYRVTGDTMIAGEKVINVARTTSVTAGGAGTLQGTPISMTSVSSSAGAFYLTPKGVFVGADSEDDVDIKITILAQNAEISIKQKGQTKINTIR